MWNCVNGFEIGRPVRSVLNELRSEHIHGFPHASIESGASETGYYQGCNHAIRRAYVLVPYYARMAPIALEMASYAFHMQNVHNFQHRSMFPSPESKRLGNTSLGCTRDARG